MSTPITPTPSPSPAKKPVVVIPGFTRRDVIVSVFIAILVLVFIGFAIFKTGTERSPNLLRGEVVGRYAEGEKETLLTVSRQGVKSKTADTGFYLKVKVEPEGRVYDVMVSEMDYHRYKDGARLDFVRPASEQK